MKEDEDATGSARTTMAERWAKVPSRGLVCDSVCEHFVDDAAGCLHDPVVKKYEHPRVSEMILVLVGLRHKSSKFPASLSSLIYSHTSKRTDTRAALSGPGSSSAPHEPLVSGINGVPACFSSTPTRFQFCENINVSRCRRSWKKIWIWFKNCGSAQKINSDKC